MIFWGLDGAFGPRREYGRIDRTRGRTWTVGEPDFSVTSYFYSTDFKYGIHQWFHT